MTKLTCRIFKLTYGDPARLAAALLLALTGISAQAQLQGRDLDGDPTTFEAYYDLDKNISWLATPSASGLLKWDAAKTWVEGLNVYGITGWRMPTTLVPDSGCSNTTDTRGSFGYGCGGSEMGHLYIVEGITTGAPGGFIGLATDWYWSSTRFPVVDTDAAHVFLFASGGVQSGDWAVPGRFLETQLPAHYAWAVHDGDVGVISSVPEPETYAMLLAGLGLIGVAVARHKRTF